MKGYIYRLYKGADPAKGWIFNDPIFGNPATLGACVPNVRRQVVPGDWVFAISGRVNGYRPFVAGGFQVAEKITALEAYSRFPKNRLQVSGSGQVVGNIIVDETGKHHPLDHHDKFDERLKNYLVGGTSVAVADHRIDDARETTLGKLSKVFGVPANRDLDIVPRWRRVNEEQIAELTEWLAELAE